MQNFGQFITTSLYRHGLPPAANLPPNRFGQLQKLAEVVINLALPTSDNALINEKELVETTGMRYVQIPVVWEQPTEANLASFLHAMTMYESQRVFIHCAANMRVSVFMALYRIRSLGWSRDDAMQMVYEIWKPNEIWSRFIEQNLRE